MFVSFAFVGMSSEYMTSTNADSIILPVSPSTLQSPWLYVPPPCVMVTALDIEKLRRHDIEKLPRHNRRGRKGGPRRLSQVNTKVIVSDEPRRSTRLKRTFLQYDTVQLWASVQRRKRKSK